MTELRFPAPYAGNKATVASLVWQHLGRVDHYREPFCGSAAVLLAAPEAAATEIINDASGHVTNVLRAIGADPDMVAALCDWPINEIDLFARHVELVKAEPALTERLMSDPGYFDGKLAAWWLWGASQWIGSDWATGRGSWTVVNGQVVKGRGVARKAPAVGVAVGREHGMKGVHRKMPSVAAAGDYLPWKGVHKQMPTLAASPSNPYGQPRGVANQAELTPWFRSLSARLRHVRILCGEWDRILSDSVCWNYKGVKGVFVDPPYPGTDNSFYAVDNAEVWHAAQAWAIEHGNRPDARICLAGLDDQKMPASWRPVTWSRNGGYGNQSDGAGRANAAREVLWFSPTCGAIEDLPMWREIHLD